MAWNIQNVHSRGGWSWKCPCPKFNVPFYFAKMPFYSQNCPSIPELPLYFPEFPFYFPELLLFIGIAVLFSKSAFYFSKCPVVFQNCPLILEYDFLCIVFKFKIVPAVTVEIDFNMCLSFFMKTRAARACELYWHTILFSNINWSPFFRSSHRKSSVKKVVLKNFANFTGKHLYWVSF